MKRPTYSSYDQAYFAKTKKWPVWREPENRYRVHRTHCVPQTQKLVDDRGPGVLGPRKRSPEVTKAVTERKRVYNAVQRHKRSRRLRDHIALAKGTEDW